MDAVAAMAEAALWVSPSERRAAGLLAAWRRLVRAWPSARRHTLRWVAAGEGKGRAAQTGRGRRWPVVHLAFPGGPARALLVAGVHGDEPSGPCALWRFFAGGQAAPLVARWSFDLLPLANPSGYDLGTRGGANCDDLNRMFADPAACPEADAILGLVARAPAGGPHRPPADLLASGLGWDLVLSLHEDTEARCLYLYDTGCRERHQFAAAIAQSVAFLDWVEGQGVAVCAEPFLDDDPNRGGVLIGAQSAFPALEPTLFRTGAAARVVIVEAPGLLPQPVREQLHLGALMHFLSEGVPAGGKRPAVPRQSAADIRVIPDGSPLSLVEDGMAGSGKG